MTEQNSQNAIEPLMTAEEVAGVVRKSPLTVKKWVKLGKIPFVRIEGENLFRRGDIERWIEDRSQGQAA